MPPLGAHPTGRASRVIDVTWSDRPWLTDADRSLVVDAGSDCGPFAHPAVFDAWLATYGQQQPVRIGRASHDGQPVGLLVLTERPSDPGCWRLWGSSVDVGTVVIHHGAERACWSRWLDGDEASGPLVLRNLLNAHRSTEGLLRACREHRRATRIIDRRAMPFVDLRSGFDAWLAGRSKSQRRQFRRSLRCFERMPDVTVTAVESRDGVADALHHFFELHARRFDALDRSSVYDDPTGRDFLAAMAPALAGAGRFRAHLASRGAATVGVSLVVTSGSTWFSFNGGWDPDHREHHIGTVMLLHEIEAAAGAGAATVLAARGRGALQVPVRHRRDHGGVVDRRTPQRGHAMTASPIPSLPLDLRDYIVVIDDGLPRWLSRKLLARHADGDTWELATIDDGEPNPHGRNCDLVNLTRHADDSGDPAARMLVANLDQLVREWTSAYRDRVRPLELTGHSGFGLIRYRTGGFYGSHIDEHPDQRRTLSAIGICDTDFDGGALSFFRGAYELALRPGQVCLFPSSFLYPHAVLPVVRGTRYSVVTWLR